MPQFHLAAANRRDPSVHDSRQRVIVVGRRVGCEVQLVGHSVSEIHAALVRRTDGVWLFDLGSRNGTRVNGRRITGRRVADGDHLQFGDSRYRIHISGSAGPPGGLVRTVLHSPVTERSEHLVKPITIVGRRGQSDLHLSGDQISRVHALLVRCGDGLVVHDLGSRSGTFVNDQRRHEALLAGGETLTFGTFQFKVEIFPQDEAPQQGAAAPRAPEDFLAAALADRGRPRESSIDDLLADMLPSEEEPPAEQPPEAEATAEAPLAIDVEEKTEEAAEQAPEPQGAEPGPKDQPQEDFDAAIAEALAAAAGRVEPQAAEPVEPRPADPGPVEPEAESDASPEEPQDKLSPGLEDDADQKQVKEVEAETAEPPLEIPDEAPPEVTQESAEPFQQQPPEEFAP